jgi:tetratricopeptide (TPR) repeat protein
MKNFYPSFFLLFYFILSAGTIYSQTTVIDSLENELKIHNANDTTRVNLLNTLAFNYKNYDVSKAEELATKANILAEKLKFKKGFAKSFIIFSKIHIEKSEFELARVDALQALKLSQELKDYKSILTAYNNLGILYSYNNQPNKALEYLKKALNTAVENRDLKRQSDILHNIGHNLYFRGDFEEATKYFEKSIAVLTVLGDEKGVLITKNIIAVIYIIQGRHAEALEILNKNLEAFKKDVDIIGIAEASSNIGIIYLERKQYNKAKQYFEEALKCYKQLKHPRDVAKNLINLGTVFINTKQTKLGQKYFEEALTINKQINNYEGLVDCYNNIGSILLLEDKPKLALDNFKSSLDLSLSLEDKRKICISKIKLSEANFLLKNYFKALDYALSGLKIANDLNMLEEQKEVNQILSNIYNSQGDYKNSLLYFKQFKKLNDSLFNKENIEKITQLEYEYKYKQKIDSANIRELKLTKTVLKTTNDLEKSQQNLLLGIITFLAIAMVLGSIIFFLRLRNSKAKTENIIIEQKLLRSQMTPHFIFNSLSVLQGMILNNEESKSMSYLSKFSKLLRITLENSRDKTVLLSQELEAVENYLSLQNIENEKISFKLSVDDEIKTNELKVPPMLIQPFVENAIEHAFKNQKENCSIEIKLTLDDSKLICEILDNGIGIDSSERNQNKNKKSLATKITSERLQYLSKDFNMEGSITIEDRSKFKEQGTKVTIQIPFLKQEA